MYASVYALNHFVIEGISFLLLQRGAGINAQRNAGFLAGLWAAVRPPLPPPPPCPPPSAPLPLSSLLCSAPRVITSCLTPPLTTATALSCTRQVTLTVHYFAFLASPDSVAGRDRAFYLQISWQAVEILFYLAVRLLPQEWLPRRPALLSYANFWIVYRMSDTASLVLQYKQLEVRHTTARHTTA